MITDIFFSLVLFGVMKYGKNIGKTKYKLLHITESDLGILEITCICNKNYETVIFFKHVDLIQDSSNQIKNWKIYGDDSDLVQEFINLLQTQDTGDFNFFKSKEFYNEIPFGTVLTITSKCNIFCHYCFNDYDYPLKDRNLRDNIGLDKYKNIVDILYKSGTRDIILTGGEPFTAPFFWELLEYIKNKGIFIRINTNGTLLSDNTLVRLNENYCVNLMVSMHEFNNEDYFLVNEKGAKLIQGLEGIKNFEKKFEKKVEQLRKVKNYPNISLDFLTILSNKNIVYLEKIYEYVLSNFSLKGWHFFRLYSTDTGPGISRAMINLAIHKIYKLNKQYQTNYKLVDSVPYCVTKNTEIAKQVIDGELSEHHNVKTIITTDGNIQIMSAFDGNLGSIFDNELMDVWKGDFVQKMLNNGFLPEECKDCKYKETCRGGSRMDANIYNGSYGAFDPLGDINNKRVL